MAEFKAFYEKWEFRLWKSDPRVTRAKPASRGIWMDWLSTMMDEGSYLLAGTLDELAIHARTSRTAVEEAIMDLFINEVAEFEFENVTQNLTLFVTHELRSYNGKVTVVSRKRKRALKAKQSNRLRQARYRDKQGSNAATTRKTTPHSKSKTITSKEVIDHDTRRPSATISPHSLLMKYHADRIGTITDGAAQGKAVKNLIKSFNIEDCLGCYAYQVSQLANHGGWRDSVNWCTVLRSIAEWKTAGRPAKWSKTNGQNEYAGRPSKVSTIEKLAGYSEVFGKYPTEVEFDDIA